MVVGGWEGRGSVVREREPGRLTRQRQGAEILVVLVSIAAIAQACAPRKPIVPPAPSVQPAVVDDLNALIQRGCFRCLEEAYAAAQTRMAPQQAFEAAALLVLRSKELGLPTDPWLARARAAAEADDSWATYVDMIDAVPADPLSGDRETLASTTRTGSRLTATITPSSTRALVPKWREALQSGGTSVYFRAYLDVALACSFEGPDERDGAVKAVVEQHGSVPLLQYRTGICGVSYASPLRTLREADAEFVDADYALGRFELQKVEGQDQEAAMRWLQSAAKAFPASPA